MIPSDDIPEFIGQIIDIIEDYTAGKIADGAESDPCAVVIEGREYDELAEKIKALMKNWKII